MEWWAPLRDLDLSEIPVCLLIYLGGEIGRGMEDEQPTGDDADEQLNSAPGSLGTCDFYWANYSDWFTRAWHRQAIVWK